jgi:hypothetical protein
LVAAVAVLASGFAVWWVLMLRGRVPVPELNGKTVEDARQIIADAQLQLREEQREDNLGREGLVIDQDPAPLSRVRPGSSVKIVVAVVLKPKMVADVSGRWDSSTNSRYDVISLESDLFFRRIPQGPNPEPVDERGSGSVSEGAVTAQWTGGDGKQPTSGRVVHQNDKGIAQVIRWNNGVIWFRPKEEGDDLVRHYHLDHYDRALVLEAIRKGAADD